MTEPTADSLTAVAADVANVVLTRRPDQVVLFGHSLGATIAFEAARSITDAGIRVALVVSARQAPHLTGRAGELDGRTADELLATVASWGGTAVDQSTRELLIPALRADFALSTGYEWDGGRVTAPVTGLSYLDDVVVDPDHVRAWAVATSAGYRHVALPGDHFAAKQPSDSLIGVLRDVVERTRSGQPVS